MDHLLEFGRNFKPPESDETYGGGSSGLHRQCFRLLDLHRDYYGVRAGPQRMHQFHTQLLAVCNVDVGTHGRVGFDDYWLGSIGASRFLYHAERSGVQEVLPAGAPIREMRTLQLSSITSLVPGESYRYMMSVLELKSALSSSSEDLEEAEADPFALSRAKSAKMWIEQQAKIGICSERADFILGQLQGLQRFIMNSHRASKLPASLGALSDLR
eukprot:1054249-Prymnesium_polylepis.1